MSWDSREDHPTAQEVTMRRVICPLFVLLLAGGPVYSLTAGRGDPVRSSRILDARLHQVSSRGSLTARPNGQKADMIDRNSRAFLFVLEFALGAPFTVSQEGVVLDELKRGWEERTEAELKKYDTYPVLAELILRAGQKDLDEIRVELEKNVREWLSGTDQSDPAVAVIRSQLNEKSRVLVPGTVPLTVRGATAYSEMYAFSELLGKIPEARPDQISKDQVAEIRQQLINAWKGFSEEQRKQVATTPGLWISLRALLRHGTPEEQAKVRGQIKKIASPARGEKGEPGDLGKRAVMNVSKHMVLMEIQKMTFNQYLYSRRTWSMN
jgi:hypothetical protein